MKTLKLDEKYSVDFDGIGATLKFAEKRLKTNKETGKEEGYTFQDKWYMLTFTQCLDRYKNLVLEESADLKEVLVKLESLETLIKGLKL